MFKTILLIITFAVVEFLLFLKRKFWWIVGLIVLFLAWHYRVDIKNFIKY